MNENYERLEGAVKRLEDLLGEARLTAERIRLGGKIEGVKLAMSYLEEDERRESTERVVSLNFAERAVLAKFTVSPNGSCRVNDRLTVEAMENGGLMVRVRPYKYVHALLSHFGVGTTPRRRV